MHRTFFLPHEKTPPLCSGFVQIVGQLALTQLGLDITIGPQESFGHQDLVMPRLVGDLKHMGLKVLLPPGVPDLAGKFTLKVPAYGINRLG
jgi:hypothetical protein